MGEQPILYAIPISGYCAKVRIVLRHKELTWQELPPPGGYGSREYKSHVPSGNLPAMVISGLLLSDSEAINEYLNETVPQNPLLSQDPGQRAKQRERGRFHDTRLEPAQRALYRCLPPHPPDPTLIERQSEEISTRLTQLASMLAPNDQWSFSLGDCGYPATFAWLEAITPILSLKIHWPQAICDYRDWLASEPAVDAELRDLVPAIRSWLSAR